MSSLWPLHLCFFLESPTLSVPNSYILSLGKESNIIAVKMLLCRLLKKYGFGLDKEGPAIVIKW